MRFLLTMVIGLQLMTSSFAAELGERKPFSAKKHLLSTIAATDARHFETALRTEIEKIQVEGMVYQNQKYQPQFKETSQGNWSYQADGNKITFSSADMFQGQVLINGTSFKFRGLPLEEVEKRAEKLLMKKTTLMERIFYNSIGIQDAQACELICAAVVIVVAAAFIGTAVYQFMVKPEKIVKRLNDMKDKMENDANMCEQSKNDQSKYEGTFALASSISDRGALGSMTSTSEALEYAMKKQLEGGARKNEDCFKIMHEVGKKVDLNIPVPTDRQIQMRELTGARLQNEKVDVANSAFNLCQSYNRLGACMENFVAAHVNNSDINSFKDSAQPSHWRYQKKMSGSRQ